ncbi:MAG TPA: zinc/iron-chelating domain-containing protein [Bacteroidales bacterium]|nr:zinc/iron-chelating domain-containing protein [Bacteroidales bacterium]
MHDRLPLTCSRAGTCCHGKQVLLNPWELNRLAAEKKISSREFRDTYCEFGGIRLRFNGKAGWKGQFACSQYIPNFGCSVHAGRPLACRLYPLGRQLQSNSVVYMFQGNEFPCLEACPEVLQLPQLTVGEYLTGQAAEMFETAQDAYLELMQNIADIAFELLLDTGLAESGDTRTLQQWRKMSIEPWDVLATRLGEDWIDLLMLPDINHELENPTAFAQKHFELLANKIQEAFGTSQTPDELHHASVTVMGIALHLARSLGADAKKLVEHWIHTAKTHGATE